MNKIVLDGLEFYAYHGFFSEEQKIGGNYRVDIEIDADFQKAIEMDELDGTIDYSEVYNLVNEEMKINSKLIEHVAGRIINRLMEEFITIVSVSVKVTKVNPPIGAKLSSVSVVLNKTRYNEG